MNKTAVFTYGRNNPPTIGHEKLFNKTTEVARRHGVKPHIVTSHSQDSNKNPLSAEHKVKYIKHAHPGAHVSSSSKDAPSMLHVAKRLHQQGHDHLVMVAGSDRVQEYKKKLHQYNGTHSKALYNFKSIKVVNAGQRDPDAEGASGMSGTKLRSHAISGNKAQFKSGLHSKLSDKHKEEIYHHVRNNLGVKEGYDPNLRISKYEWGTPEGTRHMKKMTPGEAIDETMGQTLRGLRLKPHMDNIVRGYLNYRRKNPGQGRSGVTKAAKLMGLEPRDTDHIVNHINNQVKKGKLPSHLALEATEVSESLWANIHAKRKRGEKMRKKGEKGAPTPDQIKRAQGEATEVPQDKDVAKRPGTQPAKYYKGLSKSTKQDRDRHFKRKTKMASDNPKAYTPAPGDASAETKPSKHTIKFKQMFGEAYNTPAAEALPKKSYPRFAALTDLDLNTKSRNMTIDEYSYGPANPNNEEDSREFWENKADLWNTSVDQVKSMRCSNCAAFNQTPEVMSKIKEGLGPKGDDIIAKSNLGYCEFFEFKCAGNRTCDAWVGGGPLTEASNVARAKQRHADERERLANQHRREKEAMKSRHTGQLDRAQIRTIRSEENVEEQMKPTTTQIRMNRALKKVGVGKNDEFYKSKMDPETRKKYEPSKRPEPMSVKAPDPKKAFKWIQTEDVELTESEALKKKAAKSGISLGTLKKVYNRGMAAWRTGHRPGTTPQQWGMARVNSYITKGKGTYHGADKDLREAEEKAKRELTDKEIDKMIDDLSWEDIIDLYDPEELEEDTSEDLQEKISQQSRIKKRLAFMRSKPKRSTAKKIKLKRASPPDVIKRRAKVAARNAIMKKMLRGRKRSQLSAGEKDRIEARVGKILKTRSNLALKMIPKIRQIEKERLSKK